MKQVKAGSMVEYCGILGTVHVKVIKIAPSGKLHLNTAKMGLIKNVSVMPHKVFLSKRKRETTRAEIIKMRAKRYVTR